MKKEDREIKLKYGTISLPLPLIEKIKKRIAGTGMNSVSAYVAFILRQILSSPYQDSENVLNRDEEGEIRRRLKSLGY